MDILCPTGLLLSAGIAGIVMGVSENNQDVYYYGATFLLLAFGYFGLRTAYNALVNKKQKLENRRKYLHR